MGLLPLLRECGLSLFKRCVDAASDAGRSHTHDSSRPRGLRWGAAGPRPHEAT